MKVLAIAVALFCGLSAIFVGVAASTPYPTKKTSPAPQVRVTWV